MTSASPVLTYAQWRSEFSAIRQSVDTLGSAAQSLSIDDLRCLIHIGISSVSPHTSAGIATAASHATAGSKLPDEGSGQLLCDLIRRTDGLLQRVRQAASTSRTANSRLMVGETLLQRAIVYRAARRLLEANCDSPANKQLAVNARTLSRQYLMAEAQDNLTASFDFMAMEKEKMNANLPTCQEALVRAVVCTTTACGVLLTDHVLEGECPVPRKAYHEARATLSSHVLADIADECRNIAADDEQFQSALPATDAVLSAFPPVAHSPHLPLVWVVLMRLAYALETTFSVREQAMLYYELSAVLLLQTVPRWALESGVCERQGSPDDAGAAVGHVGDDASGSTKHGYEQSVAGREVARHVLGRVASPSVEEAGQPRVLQRIFSRLLHRHRQDKSAEQQRTKVEGLNGTAAVGSSCSLYDDHNPKQTLLNADSIYENIHMPQLVEPGCLPLFVHALCSGAFTAALLQDDARMHLYAEVALTAINNDNQAGRTVSQQVDNSSSHSLLHSFTDGQVIPSKLLLFREQVQLIVLRCLALCWRCISPAAPDATALDSNAVEDDNASPSAVAMEDVLTACFAALNALATTVQDADDAALCLHGPHSQNKNRWRRPNAFRGTHGDAWLLFSAAALPSGGAHQHYPSSTLHPATTSDSGTVGITPPRTEAVASQMDTARLLVQRASYRRIVERAKHAHATLASDKIPFETQGTLQPSAMLSQLVDCLQCIVGAVRKASCVSEGECALQEELMLRDKRTFLDDALGQMEQCLLALGVRHPVLLIVAQRIRRTARWRQ